MYQHSTLSGARRAKRARKQFPSQSRSQMSGCQAYLAGRDAAASGSQRKVPGDVFRAGVAAQWYKGFDSRGSSK